MTCSRLAVATHLLAYLTWRRGQPVSSTELARSIETNPVVVRRLVSALREAGIVRVRQGAAGGAELARAPESITLHEVYRAVQPDDELFALPSRKDRSGCPLGCSIGGALGEVFERAEAAIERVLGGVTLAEVYESLAPRLPVGRPAA
jgi:Rrf2 family protein